MKTLLAIALLVLVLPASCLAAEGEMRYGMHVTLPAKWLDPGDMEGFSTPYMIVYAIHDAMVKPMPAGMQTPSLAESWSEAKDHLSYTFTLRKNAKFHDGSPVTPEDVKFSFERYKGTSATLLKEKVKEVQVVSPTQVRFVLKEPWPDFMLFYGTTASGAGWIVPKKYVEKVGEDGYKKAPVGAGPYKVVSFTPGVEIVLEAFDGYWRKAPNVKRIVMPSMTEETTRAAALKRGEVDLAYLFAGPVAEELKRTRGSKLEAELLAAVALPIAFGAGDLHPLPPYSPLGEAIVGYLQAIGIKTRMRTMERAAFVTAWREKKLRGIIMNITSVMGNAATRLEPYATKSGIYTYGSLPEIDDLFARQARELDLKKREALVHRMQSVMTEHVLNVPIYDLAFIWGVGPRVEFSGANAIPGFPYSAPFEDLKIKK